MYFVVRTNHSRVPGVLGNEVPGFPSKGVADGGVSCMHTCCWLALGNCSYAAVGIVVALSQGNKVVHV